MFCPFSNVEVDSSHCGHCAPNQASTEQVAWGTRGKRKQWSIGTPLFNPGNNYYLVFLDLTWLTDVYNSARTSSEQIPCNETPTSPGVTGERTILKSVLRVSGRRNGTHQDVAEGGPWATWSERAVPEEKMRTWHWRMALWHQMHPEGPWCHQGLFLGGEWEQLSWFLRIPYKQGCFCLIFLVFVFFNFLKKWSPNSHHSLYATPIKPKRFSETKKTPGLGTGANKEDMTFSCWGTGIFKATNAWYWISQHGSLSSRSNNCPREEINREMPPNHYGVPTKIDNQISLSDQEGRG